jgi:excisionase family DNA binding protein
MAIDHEILTVKEVGELLKVHQGTVYKMVRVRIPAFKIGSDWLLPPG